MEQYWRNKMLYNFKKVQKKPDYIFITPIYAKDIKTKDIIQTIDGAEIKYNLRDLEYLENIRTGKISTNDNDIIGFIANNGYLYYFKKYTEADNDLLLPNEFKNEN